ncbi:piggyBac transposable element-derived protein 1-like [Pecten maximus]|uniref:piggyBac transposable element-derived protein 1-like n=1 Tax=Pecten maximus TaxID=6579 RepID=UPI001458684F|nr:piggyBac transposable element-derived protein 1-like [Pecten maximus]
MLNKNHHLYMDNFFSSPALFTRLLQDGIYACGTVRATRQGYPKELQKGCVKKKGDHLSMQKGPLSTSAWFDNKQVNFLYTNVDATKLSEVSRKKKDGTTHVSLAPEAVQLYGSRMNAVDRADQLRMQYSCSRKSLKWWKYLFYFLLDTAIVNSFLLMKESPNHKLTTRTGKEKIRTQISYRQELARQLIGETRVTRKRKAQPTTMDTTGHQHWPEILNKKGRCRQCSKSGRRREVISGCSHCNVKLCVGCFKDYHQSLLNEL